MTVDYRKKRGLLAKIMSSIKENKFRIILRDMRN
jgi:hypothetical protein